MRQNALYGLVLVLAVMMWGLAAHAAPYAALVMDARTGKVIHSENADARLHPASLTKMMTLYIVFSELRSGRLSAEQKVTVSKYAASKPPSKLGLKPGQRIELKYLVRASAVKSANDAATVLAEAVSGSEEAFARRMTAVARSMGMSNTTFKNPSGLTQAGHMSSARDMSLLARRLFYDFPEYYNLFSRRSTDAKLATVNNTNRRLLDAYEGADGIKTGYTQAAGFNLAASAKRGEERVIVVVMGGQSSAWRNQRVAKLLDLGFSKAPTYARVDKPAPLRMAASTATTGSADTASRQRGGLIATSARPHLRPASQPDIDTILIAAAVDKALASVSGKAVAAMPDDTAPVAAAVEPAPFSLLRPRPRPADLPVAKTVRVASLSSVANPAPEPVVTSAGDTAWIVQLGGTYGRSEAERLLLTTALQELEALEGSRRHLAPTSDQGRYRPQFVGLGKQEAQTACARLAARQTACEVMQTGS